MMSLRLIIAGLGLLEAVFPANLPPSGCLAVGGEYVLAGDLAAANRVFASLNPELVIGPSPMAGARRYYRRPELASLVRRHQLPPTPLREVCFEWPVLPLIPGTLATAMARELDCDAAAIEIVEQSRFPAPPGELIFARADLVPVPGSTGPLQLWRGFVRYGTNRKFPVWVRVRIALPAVRIVALTTLLPGQPVQESQLERRAVMDATSAGIFATTVKELAGRVPARRIEPGNAIRIGDLKSMPDIAAGDEVQVEVRNGGLRVFAVARAEQSGRLGDTIPLTNIQTSARFRARVEGKDRVSLTVQPRELR